MDFKAGTGYSTPLLTCGAGKRKIKNQNDKVKNKNRRETWIPACAGMTSGRGSVIWGRGMRAEGKEDGFPPARK